MFYKRIALAMIMLAAGCSASVTHTVVNEADNGTGIRYYQSSPYLLVYSDSKGGLVWQILFLPDQTKKMMVEPKVHGGRSEMTLYFKNGILAGSMEVGDTTELPKAVLAAVQSAVPLFARAALEAARPSVPAPYLYKIVVNDREVKFIGNQGDEPIIIVIKEAKP